MSVYHKLLRFVIVLVLLVPLLAACGDQGQAPTERPRAGPAEPSGRPPSGSPPNPGDAFENLQNLPGYHYEGTFQVYESGEEEQFLRFVQDVDTVGNYHLQAYDQQEAGPALDLYAIGDKVYLYEDGQYSEMGEIGADPATLSRLYLMPFQAFLLGAADLEEVGQETVNGLPATKYEADFSRWVTTYLQATAGATYTSEGLLWISEEYGAIVKSEARATVTRQGEQAEVEIQTEISRVGQIEPIEPPN